MEFSFQLYSARNFTPWENVYKSIATLGYKQVEGFGGVYEDAAATREHLDAAGLTMPSGHYSLDSLENDLDATIKTAQILGSTHLFCPHLAADERPEDAAGWQSFGKRINSIGKQVNDKGLRFGWHNHDFEFIACADGSIPMRQILESAPDIDWEMDVAWTARTGTDPAPWIKEFGSRITAVHVKDIAVQGENEDEDGWADIGFGNMDWKSLMAKLIKESNATLYVAEHDNPNSHERFSTRSIASLQSFV